MDRNNNEVDATSKLYLRSADFKLDVKMVTPMTDI